MLLPNAPTDSLWKFVAVLGLSIVIICGYQIFKIGHDRNAAWRKHYVEYLKLEVELERLGFTTMDDSPVLKLEHVEDDPIEQHKRELQTRFANKYPDFSKKWLDSAAEHEELRLKDAYDRSVLLLFIIGIVLGSSISAIGFAKWYNYYQKPFDRQSEHSINVDQIK